MMIGSVILLYICMSKLSKLAKDFQFKLAQIKPEEQSKLNQLIVGSRNSVVAAVKLVNDSKVLNLLQDQFTAATSAFYKNLNVQPPTRTSLQSAIDNIGWMQKVPSVLGVNILGDDDSQTWWQVSELLEKAKQTLQEAKDLVAQSYRNYK